MVSVFLVFVAMLSFLWSLIHLYETRVTAGEVGTDDLLVTLLCWTISAACFASAAVLDSVTAATRRMCRKLDDLAKPSK